MPVAIDEIRKLGKQGHSVFASDTFTAAPGSHSKFVAGARLTAPPRNTQQFIADFLQIVRDDQIELVLPAFEEAFFLAKHAAELAPYTRLFLPDFATLARLHDKASLLDLAQSLGIDTARTQVVASQQELALAILDFDEYFARPSYSRGGVQLLTNSGPLAGALSIDDCTPTSSNPWLVQEFVHGLDVCTFSIAHHGRMTGHSAYIHPREIEHAGGIVFESVAHPGCLEIARKIIEATGYHGQISFDFLETSRGVLLVECNPRPTAGVHVMSPAMFEAALFDEAGSSLRVVEPGIQRKYSIALVRDMVLHLREAPSDLKHLFSRAREVMADPEDLLPALYQIISYGHVRQYRRELNLGRHKRTDLMAAYFYDVCWDGEPIE